MTNRERFFHVLKGGPTDRAPFFPDISTWYQASRLGLGAEQPYPPGGYIPDDSLIHKKESLLSGAFSKMTFLDYYREYGWGLPVHAYNWYDKHYTGGVEKLVTTTGRHRRVTWDTPQGDLERTYKLDAEGAWSEYGHMATLGDLDTVRYIVEHTEWTPRFAPVERFLRETEGYGVADTVVFRSPFGKLIHEYMGFEAVTYALFDHEETVLEFLEFQEEYDLQFVALAASSPSSIVIISDHADENLIAPSWYQRYCMPYYKKACDLVHGAGKYASTHLDGNFHGYLPFIQETGFDLLDGCTPAPMFNYEVEELAAAVGKDMSCYCGVPATMFTTELPTSQITQFGERIAREFDGRVIVNVGDILPPTGDIDRVIALGAHIQSL